MMEWLPGPPEGLDIHEKVAWLEEQHGLGCMCYLCVEAWREKIVTPRARQQLARIGEHLATLTDAEFHGHERPDVT